jgi:cytochrome o ubiquinol oxidase operon protein cyoD
VRGAAAGAAGVLPAHGQLEDQRSNTGIFICTALLIAIVVAGSLWVMHNANLNMMPMQLSPAEARAKE